jgi:hypothetical protein
MRGKPNGCTYVSHGNLRIDSHNINRLMDKIELIKAYANGATIQYLDTRDGMWEDLTGPDFDCETIEYRVKPKPREFLIVVDAEGVVRDAGNIEAYFPKYTDGRFEMIRVREIV